MGSAGSPSRPLYQLNSLPKKRRRRFTVLARGQEPQAPPPRVTALPATYPFRGCTKTPNFRGLVLI